MTKQSSKAGLLALVVLVTVTYGSIQPASATASFVISTVVGTGSAGYSGDGGAATSAQINSPGLTTFDTAGNLYVAEGDRVRRITPGGTISTYAGTGTGGYSGDGGAATSAQLNRPWGIRFDTSGNLFIAEYWGNRIRKVTPGGIISTFAGTGTGGYSGDGGAATSAQLNQPASVSFDLSGNLYTADTNNHRIRKITPGGVISTVAGTGTGGYSGDGGAATSSQLNNPLDALVGPGGELYIVDWHNNRIRKITTGGVISTIAGTGVGGFSGDGGAATSAELYDPNGMALDSAGTIYIADYSNHRLRAVTTGGIISTVAGTGAAGYSGDGAAATDAQLNGPAGVTIDSDGNVYVSELAGHRVRKIALLAPASSSVAVSATIDPSLTFTVAGRGTLCNGQPATNFQTGSSSTAVSLGRLSTSTLGGGAQDLTVASNAGNGFTVYVRTPGTTPSSLQDSSARSITDVSGTNAAPGAVPIAGTPGFGYTSSDTSTSFTSNTWAKLTNTNEAILISSIPQSKSACIGYEVAVGPTTSASTYSTVSVYTAVASF